MPRANVTPQQYRMLSRKQGGRCQACGRRCDVQLDHVVPVASGGSDALANLQFLCGRCNKAKGDRTIDYRGWRGWLPFRIYRRFQLGRLPMRTLILFCGRLLALGVFLVAALFIVPVFAPMRGLLLDVVQTIWTTARWAVILASSALALGWLAIQWENRQWVYPDEYGQLPMRKSELKRAPQLAIQANVQHQKIRIVQARYQVPQHLSLRIDPPRTGEEPRPAAPIDVPSFAALLERNLIAPGQPIILGYTQDGMLQGAWKDLYSAAVAGIPGSGKTTTVRFLTCQAALQGAQFAIIDPHAGVDDESLAATLSPLQTALLCEVASTERTMLDVLRLIERRMTARLEGDADRTPLLLCIDEFTSLMRNERLAPALSAMVESLAQQGRKVNVFALLAGQIWTAQRSGGTSLRDSLASCYVHRLKRNQARLLLPTDEAQHAENLAAGRALLVRTNGDSCEVSIPNTTGADVERVGVRLASCLAAAAMPQLANGRHPKGNADGKNTTSQSAKLVSAEAKQAAELFLAGTSIAEIVEGMRGVSSTTGGRRYREALAEVQDLIREGLAKEEAHA